MDLWSILHCRGLPSPGERHLKLLSLRTVGRLGFPHSRWTDEVATTGGPLLPEQITEQVTGNSVSWLPVIVSNKSGETSKREEPSEEHKWSHSVCLSAVIESVLKDWDD